MKLLDSLMKFKKLTLAFSQIQLLHSEFLNHSLEEMMMNRINPSAGLVDFRRQIRNPRNIRGGVNGGDIIRIGGNLSDVSVEDELNTYLGARKKLFIRARAMIRNRVKNQMMKAFHGAAAVVYGIKFIYDADIGDWRGSIDNANSFIEHILGVAATGKTIRDLNADWVKTLLNINNMETFIVHGDPRPGMA